MQRVDEPQLQLIQRRARRLLRLINQLLDLSKLEAGGMDLHARRSDAAAFVRELTLLFTGRAEPEGITLTFTARPGMVMTAFDPDKLEKIIFNLLSECF